MDLNKIFHNILMVTSIGMAVISCNNDKAHSSDDKEQIVYGNEVTVGNGVVKSFVKKDTAGNPSTIGLAFSEATLSGLPQDGGSFTIPMPGENGTIVNHISFDYAPHHPALIYDTPHISAHFFLISEEERNAIKVTGPEIDVIPPAAFHPKDYVPTPGGASKMGKRWTDTTGEELKGKPFKRAIAYNSYNGKFISLEPSYNLSFLQAKLTNGWPVKEPGKVQEEGFYPSAYSVSFDAASKTYMLTLDDLKFKKRTI